MHNKRLIELRDHLEAYIQQLKTKGNLPSSSEIITGFQKAFATEVAASAIDLQRIALTKFVSDISFRKSHKSWSPKQNELFEKLGGIPNAISISIEVSGTRKRAKLTTPNATYSQIISWLDDKKKQKLVVRRAKYEKFDSLVEEIRAYFTSDETTLEEAYKLFLKEQKKRAA